MEEENKLTTISIEKRIWKQLSHLKIEGSHKNWTEFLEHFILNKKGEQHG